MGVGVLEKCLNVGKFVKSFRKVVKKRAQKLVGLLNIMNFLEGFARLGRIGYW